MIEGWIGPICITGEKGVPGADGSSLEFIYTLTANETSIPAYPSSLSDLKTLFDATEGGDSTEHYAEYQGQNGMIELSLLIQIIIELVEWHKELKLLEQQNGHIIHLDQ